MRVRERKVTCTVRVLATAAAVRPRLLVWYYSSIFFEKLPSAHAHDNESRVDVDQSTPEVAVGTGFFWGLG